LVLISGHGNQTGKGKRRFFKMLGSRT